MLKKLIGGFTPLAVKCQAMKTPTLKIAPSFPSEIQYL
jgi:hypothetical protein